MLLQTFWRSMRSRSGFIDAADQIANSRESCTYNDREQFRQIVARLSCAARVSHRDKNLDHDMTFPAFHLRASSCYDAPVFSRHRMSKKT